MRQLKQHICYISSTGNRYQHFVCKNLRKIHFIYKFLWSNEGHITPNGFQSLTTKTTGLGEPHLLIYLQFNKKIVDYNINLNIKMVLKKVMKMNCLAKADDSCMETREQLCCIGM